MPVVAIDNTSCRGKKRQERIAVPVMTEAFSQFMSLPRDIQTILDSGVTRRCLGRSLGVSFVTTWRWQHGIREPDYLTALVLHLWAIKLRDNHKEEATHGT